MATVAGTAALEKSKARTEKIARFDVHQILQHIGLMTSFILLVFTGLPLKFHEAQLSQWFAGILGGIETTRTIHHLAAYVMVFVCLYHGIYLIYTLSILKRPFPVKMIPNIQDFMNLFHEMLYFTGLLKTRPQFDRFNWREKFDYWAIFWGMPVMAGSGFILMYPVLATRYLPGWIVPASLIAHSDEAILALTWIFLVHIFFNHFTPGYFPLNTSIFTGKLSVDHYQREHPLEYEKIRPTAAAKAAEKGNDEIFTRNI
ncbi:MAG: cytochrome b/b6 domain-containing protein [Dehalococcoidales bacterium]|nr:cytochrome b/b6 domain-containing protein [Dehalococcoidales bacterium]